HTRFSRDWSSDVCSSDLPSGPRTVTETPSPSGAIDRTSCSNSTSALGSLLRCERVILAVLNCSHWTTYGKRVSSAMRAWSNSATSAPVARSQNWNMGATNPASLISASSPSSSSSSSVAGWVVAARGSSLKSSSLSKTVTGTPFLASPSAQIKPTGPPPQTMTRSLHDTAGSLLDMEWWNQHASIGILPPAQLGILSDIMTVRQ